MPVRYEVLQGPSPAHFHSLLAHPTLPRSQPKRAERSSALTEEEIEEMREAFKLFDTDGSGASLPLW